MPNMPENLSLAALSVIEAVTTDASNNTSPEQRKDGVNWDMSFIVFGSVVVAVLLVLGGYGCYMRYKRRQQDRDRGVEGGINGDYAPVA